MPVVHSDFVETGAATATGAVAGGASGSAAEVVSGGGISAWRCTDSRTVRFALISLIPVLASRAPHIAAHNLTIINDDWCFKWICALHKKNKKAAREGNPGITRGLPLFAHATPVRTERTIGQKQWRYREQASGRREQYKRKIRVFNGFSAFLYRHEDE